VAQDWPFEPAAWTRRISAGGVRDYLDAANCWIYIDEFSAALTMVGRGRKPNRGSRTPMTPFERKYAASGMACGAA
jgi:hypothetical protein